MSHAPPRIFLRSPATPRRCEPLDGESEHVLRVLRLRVGDSVVGLDGVGGSYPLRIADVSRKECRFALDGEPRFDPQPGANGAALPWIEVAVAWPKPNRAEEMLDRLTQLGVAAIRPLDCTQAGPHGMPNDGVKRERCLRALREACKQSRRTWLPELHAPHSVDELCAQLAASPHGADVRDGAPETAAADASASTHDASAPTRIAVLTPMARLGLAEWIAGEPELRTTTRAVPLILCVGPEGGFSAQETTALSAARAMPVRLGPHILRIETAAEAAVAVATTLLARG